MSDGLKQLEHVLEEIFSDGDDQHETRYPNEGELKLPAGKHVALIKSGEKDNGEKRECHACLVMPCPTGISPQF